MEVQTTSALNLNGGAPPPAANAITTPANPAPVITSPTTVNGSAPEKTWRESLPDDLKNDPNLLPINDVNSLAKSFIHAQKMVGSDKVGVPGKHATDEDWQNVYDKLGRPKVEEYKVTLPKDSKFIDENFMKELTPLAHKAGILPKQLEPVLSWYEQTIAKAEATIATEKEASIKAGLDSLKKEYGVAYEQKLSYAHSLLKEHATPELLKLVDENREIGNNPALIKLLSKVGEMLYKEDGMPDAGQSSGGKHTPDEARNKANMILSDATHPYNMSEHPNHAAAVKEVQGLWKMAYPDEEKA
jgi:hypothetical protein